jgi:hypothetical protein
VAALAAGEPLDRATAGVSVGPRPSPLEARAPIRASVPESEGEPADPGSAGEEWADGEFWLDPALDALRRLADGDGDGASARVGDRRGADGARARLFLALGALRARLTPVDDAVGRSVQEGSGGEPSEQPRVPALPRAAGECAVAALAAQDPAALDPSAIPLLDAHARGVFGGAAGEGVEAVVDAWLAPLATGTTRAERERRRWGTALAGLCPQVPEHRFPTLRTAAGAGWAGVATALRAASLPETVEEWCAALDAARAEPASGPTADDESLAAVDAALAALVGAPDVEETALATRIREADARLRGPADGERDIPRPDVAPESAPVSAAPELRAAPFTQWLATLAVAPERVGASPALRRWAALRARGSILGAFDLLADEARAEQVGEVAVEIQGWRGRLGAGPADDAGTLGALLQSLQVDMRRRGTVAELAIRMPGGAGALLWAALLMLALAATTRGWALALAGGGALTGWWLARQAHARRRARARAAAGMAHARAAATLRTVAEEWSAARRERADGLARLPDARERLRRTLA